jgi:predicted amidohydrolase YtcJ
MALERAGISIHAPDPQGGRFDRDPDTGRLTGKVREKASDAIEAVITKHFRARTIVRESHSSPV